MSGLQKKLGSRIARVKRNPRRFVPLLPPFLFVLGGWVALAINWQRSGVVLVSAGLALLAVLIWMQLRRLQGSIDRAAVAAAVSAKPLPVAPSQPVVPVAAEVVDEAELGFVIDRLDATGALSAGLPPALVRAFGVASITIESEILLVVPAGLALAAETWAVGATQGRWRIAGGLPGGPLERSRAAGLDVVIIVDGVDMPCFDGVLDQTFFWWLPASARMLLVSGDPSAFAARLAAHHDVDLAMGESTPGVTHVIVSRTKG